MFTMYEGISRQDVQRNPGDKWMVKGPQDFCPTVEMEIVSRRKAIPLDANEGIYIRNVKTGKVGIEFILIYTLFTFQIQLDP